MVLRRRPTNRTVALPHSARCQVYIGHLVRIRSIHPEDGNCEIGQNVGKSSFDAAQPLKQTENNEGELCSINQC